jgi:predicted Zn-dependent protease
MMALPGAWSGQGASVVDKAQLLSWERQAKTAVERENWALAEERLARLLEAAPETWSFWRLYAQVLRELGRIAEAEKALVGAVKRCPEEVIEEARDLCLELADLRLQDGRPNDAARALKRVLAREPHQWEALYLMGNAFMDVGATAEALSAYEQSLASQPFEAELWWNYALALEKAGDSKGAATAYQAYLKQAHGLDAETRDEVVELIARLHSRS